MILDLGLPDGDGLDVDQGFRVQREFTADAAHELRTPLSILRTRIDTLDDQGIADALKHDIESMSRILGQLLDVAELEIVLSAARKPVWARGNPEMLRRAIRNLTEDAIRLPRTGP